jgi:hypothetical protein
MSATSTTPVSDGTVPDTDLSRPTRHRLYSAIIREAMAAGITCSWERAADLVLLLNQVLEVFRSEPDFDVYLLDDEDMAAFHDVMIVVMPDDQDQPPDGSAHDLIHQYLLQDGELALVLTKDMDGPVDYAVALELR